MIEENNYQQHSHDENSSSDSVSKDEDELSECDKYTFFEDNASQNLNSGLRSSKSKDKWSKAINFCRENNPKRSFKRSLPSKLRVSNLNLIMMLKVLSLSQR